MTGAYDGKSAEQELGTIRAVQDWNIPQAKAFQRALTSLDTALKALVEAEDAWQGASGDAARQRVRAKREEFVKIEGLVGTIVQAIETANSQRRAIVSNVELPSAQVPVFWGNLIDLTGQGGTVNYPGLGILQGSTARATITEQLTVQRDAQAQVVVESVRTEMQPPTEQIAKARAELAGGSQFETSQQGGPGGYSGGLPSGSGYPSGSGSSGGVSFPGGGRGGYDPLRTVPPGDASGTGGSSGYGGPGGTGGTGGTGGSGSGGSVTIDDPRLNGHLPGGVGAGSGGLGGAGGGHGVGGIGGAMPGGLLGGVGGGGAALGLAAARGFGGAAGLAGLKSGGLLGAGGTGGMAGGGGVGGVGGAGAAGAAEPGASGMGARGGAMVGGQSGASSDDEKRRGSGLGGPIAPHLEDDQEPIERSRGAQAGSRDQRGNR